MKADAEPLPAPSDRWAWFIDFDGTLVDIAEKPGHVTVPDQLPLCLEALRRKVDGALAIVTGRPARNIHDLLAPFRPLVAGLHGWEELEPDGTLHPPPAPSAEICRVRSRFLEFTKHHPGLMLEDKGIAVGLHYREAPDCEQAVRTFAKAEMSGLDGLDLIDGKMVVEVRLAGRTKGSAVLDFMLKPRFSGRIPVYAGDDTTDEDAFAEVNRLGGISILIGEKRSSQALWHLPSPSAFRSYLATALA